MKFVDCISAIGGTMGLFTGFSVISAIEILYFIFNSIGFIFNSKKWNWEVDIDVKCFENQLNKMFCSLQSVLVTLLDLSLLVFTCLSYPVLLREKADVLGWTMNNQHTLALSLSTWYTIQYWLTVKTECRWGTKTKVVRNWKLWCQYNGVPSFVVVISNMFLNILKHI